MSNDAISTDGHEIIWITIRSNCFEIIGFGAVYRPGSCTGSDLSLLTSLKRNIREVKTFSDNVAVCMDLNVLSQKWLMSNKTCRAGAILEEICDSQWSEEHFR